MRQLKITKQVTNRDTASLDKYLQEIGRVDLITAEEEVFLGTLTEDNNMFTDLTAGNYVLFSYDFNGCCGQTLISMDQPGENTLSLSDYEPIACPDGETELNFTIEGSVGQFNIVVDGDTYEESVEGGTITVSSNDTDLDGVPDDFK